MAYHADILLGKIIKSHGFEGAVTVRLETAFQGRVPEMESVFLEFEGKPVPFLISSYEILDNKLIRMVFDGYDSLEKIRILLGCRIFLSTAADVEFRENDSLRIIGYQINTVDNKLLGTVMEMIENPGQILLKIQDKKGNEILVPFHEDLITTVDNKNKVITMDLPEGLTEIND